MNVFEKASKLKIRFSSVKGLISTEDLWNVPLKHSSGFSLNEIAKNLNKVLKESEEEDFVEEKSEADSNIALGLDIAKHIIKVKLEEKSNCELALSKKLKRQKILSILADKKDGALKESSIEDLEKMLEEL
jgi:hypothetical protein